jgi:hypothetical protein
LTIGAFEYKMPVESKNNKKEDMFVNLKLERVLVP